MSDRVEVDPAELSRAADITEELSNDVKNILDTLNKTLSTVETSSGSMPWGDDKLGRTFTEGEQNDGYTTSRANLLQGLEGMAATLADFATGQRQAVSELNRMEQGSAGSFGVGRG